MNNVKTTDAYRPIRMLRICNEPCISIAQSTYLLKSMRMPEGLMAPGSLPRGVAKIMLLIIATRMPRTMHLKISWICRSRRVMGKLTQIMNVYYTDAETQWLSGL